MPRLFLLPLDISSRCNIPSIRWCRTAIKNQCSKMGCVKGTWWALDAVWLQCTGMDWGLSRDFKSNIHSKGRGPCVSSGDNVDNDSVKSNALADRYKWVMGAFWIMCWWWAINHSAIPTPSAEGGLQLCTGNPQGATHIKMKNNDSANFKQWFALDKHSENLGRLGKTNLFVMWIIPHLLCWNNWQSLINDSRSGMSTVQV